MGTLLKQLLLFHIKHQVLLALSVGAKQPGRGAGFSAGELQKLLLKTATWYVVPQCRESRATGSCWEPVLWAKAFQERGYQSRKHICRAPFLPLFMKCFSVPPKYLTLDQPWCER